MILQHLITIIIFMLLLLRYIIVIIRITTTPNHPHRHIVCNIDTNNNNNIGIRTTFTHNTDHNAVNRTTANNNSTSFNISYHALTSPAILCAGAIPSIGIGFNIPTSASEHHRLQSNQSRLNFLILTLQTTLFLSVHALKYVLIIPYSFYSSTTPLWLVPSIYRV